MSLLSINHGQSSDPAFEALVLEQVGSYGRQIGRIGEALAVIVAHTGVDKDDPAIKALLRQVEDVAALKAKHATPPQLNS